MRIDHTMRTRWLGGSALLAMMTVILTGCSLQLWSTSFDISATGRTPASFAADCAEKRGTLTEVDETARMGAESRCTVANGDTINCMWTFQTCFVDCFTSEKVCTASVANMGYVPSVLPATPEPGTPVPADAAFNGASSLHLIGVTRL